MIPLAHLLRTWLKDTDQDISWCAQNQYSLFTPLARQLHSRGITHVSIVGLALDYCVRATAIDARKFGFDVTLVERGTRAVGGPQGAAETLQELREVWGVKVV